RTPPAAAPRARSRATLPAAASPGPRPARPGRPPPAGPRSARYRGAARPGRPAPTAPIRARDAGSRRRAWSSGGVAAGAVEVAPVVPVPDDRLQVLPPHRAVRDRVLHDGAGDAARHVARPLVTTEIASAVDSVPLGDLTLARPSSVTPWRSSRKTVTTRLISSAPCGVSGKPIERPSSATRRATMSTSCSAEA